MTENIETRSASDNHFENFDQFKEWVVAKAEASDDYVEFYRQVIDEYLEFLLKGQPMSEYSPPVFVIKEAYKIALRQNPEACELIDQIYNLWKEEMSEKERIAKKLGIEESDAYWSTECEEMRERIQTKIQRLVSDYMTKISGGIDFDKLLVENPTIGQIEEYRSKVKDKEILMVLKKPTADLTKMSTHSNKALTPKMDRIVQGGIERTLGFAIDNHINYAPSMLTNSLRTAIQSKQTDYRRQLNLVTNDSEISGKIANDIV